MKKLIYSLFAALLVITSSCKYDDSDLWDSVNNLETRVTNLEALCNQINTNVNSLQTLVYALQDNDYVTGINPVYEGNNIIGYTISFTKSPTITIYHGKDGQNGINGTNGSNGKDGKDGRDGQDGYTPLIGVKQDVDGHYYWTLDGEWLLDNNGNKVLAEGKPGKDGQNGTNGTNGKDGKDGQDGINGTDGKDGKDGQDGINGTDGKDGKDGQNGVDGRDGQDGITPQFKIEDGDWYISLDNGLTWQYLGRAQGADGKDGQDGKDGVDGKDGQDGLNGQDGKDGQDGQNGADGKDGVDGKDGADGKDGLNGQDGKDGKDGQNGLDGKDGKDGRDGQDGRDGDSMFSSIDTSDPDFVIFTLADGTQIKLPTWYAFETLKQYCQQLNTNIQSLQTIVNAMDAGDYIVSCVPLMQDGTEIGYTITFAKSGSIVIYHGKNGLNGTNGTNGSNGTNGKDGVNGADGHSPIVGVQRDTDGVLYWTIDGDWMLDDNGKKIPVTGKDGKDGQNGTNGTNGKDGQDGKDGQNGQNGADGKDGQNGTNGKDGVDGKDGITPQFKIQEEYWWISYDNGESWEKLGRATGEKGADGKDGVDGKDGQNGTNGKDGKDGDSVFSAVSQDENYLYLTLAGSGEQIAIPKNKPFSIQFDRAEFTVQPGQTYRLNYTITGGDANTKINFYEKNGLKAELYIEDVNKGYLEVATPSSMTPKSIHELIVMVNNGYDRTLMETLTFVKGVGRVTNYSVTANSDDTQASVTLTNNLDGYTIVIPEDASEWLSQNPSTRAEMRNDIINFTIKTNGSESNRSAIVKILDTGGVEVENIYVYQHGILAKTINVDNEHLDKAIGTTDKTKIVYLFLSGELNSNDYTFISGMTNLKYLDLSNCSNTTLPTGETTSGGLLSGPGVGGEFETIILPSTLLKIPPLCFYKTKIKQIEFPSSLQSIAASAFNYCSNLSGTLYIPDNIVIGEPYTFRISVGNSTQKTIAGGVFANCKNLTTLIIGNNVKFYYSSSAFTNNFDNITFLRLYSKSKTPPSDIISTLKTPIQYLGIPKGSLNDYVSNGWNYSKFLVIEEVDFDKLGY